MIYFDNNATTRPAAEAVAAMLPFLREDYGNPSSPHAAGRSARAAVENARQSIASLIGAAAADEIIFTSGGTESDNLAIVGSMRRGRENYIVTTAVEHEAVSKTCAYLEAKDCCVVRIAVDGDGMLDETAFAAAISPSTTLVSVMLANNETGVIFPAARLAALTKQKSDALFHVDAVNAAGKIPIDVRNTEIDLLSISAHKFQGPKGVGALYVRSGVRLEPISFGGEQEHGGRAGTEAVHQIAGAGAAAVVAADLSANGRVRALLDRLEASILETIDGATVNGSRKPDLRLPNTTNISFENANGEMILAALDKAGVCVSTGSACNAESRRVSPVLAAMDVPFTRATGSIRFSLGRENTDDEVDFVLEKLPAIVDWARRFTQ